jgi:hypothetical protein
MPKWAEIPVEVLTDENGAVEVTADEKEAAGVEVGDYVVLGGNRIKKLFPVRDGAWRDRFGTEKHRIKILAEPLPDGRVQVGLYAPAEVPEDVVQGIGKLVELGWFLRPGVATEAEITAKVRDLFPTLQPLFKARRCAKCGKQKAPCTPDVLEGFFQVLRWRAAWREEMTLSERLRYLNDSLNIELSICQDCKGRVANRRQEVPRFEPLPAGREHPRSETLTESGASALGRLIARDLAAKARALPNLRDGERRVLELILSGEADTWTDACASAGLPDSYRVGLIKKLRKALAQ